MNPDFRRPSAKIFQFPAGGRAGQMARTPAQAEPRICVVETNCYHGAAIQEAERIRTPKER